MNLGYIEQNDKVLVIDEDGVRERKNQDNIKDVLNYENRLETVNKMIDDYKEEFNSEKSKVETTKYLIKYLVMCIFILISLINSIVFLIAKIPFTFLNLLYTLIVPSIIPGILILAFGSQLKNKKNIAIRLKYLIENLNKEKEDIEEYLKKLNQNKQSVINSDKISDYIQLLDKEYYDNLDEKLEVLNSEFTQSVTKPKTLKRVRKLK